MAKMTSLLNVTSQHTFNSELGRYQKLDFEILLESSDIFCMHEMFFFELFFFFQ